MGIKYINKYHQEAFEELIEQSYLTQQEIVQAGQLLKRQLAFFYIISYYQKQYREYEGVEFYIEVGEEISLDGPTYLLDDAITSYNYPHEQILVYAKQILQGKQEIHILEDSELFHELIEQAIKIVVDGGNVVIEESA